jgi:hypothetical protein
VAQAPRIVRDLDARDPNLLVGPEAASLLREWAGDVAANEGDVLGALQLFGRARAIDPTCAAPRRLVEKLDQRTDDLAGKGEVDAWLGLVTAALHARLPVDPGAFQEEVPAAFHTTLENLVRRVRERFAEDTEDWAVGLVLACVTESGNREDADPRAALLQALEGLKLAELVLKHTELPDSIRALALEARVRHRGRLVQLQERDMTARLSRFRESLADLENASRAPGPGRARCCAALALSRFLTQDREGALAAARQAVAAAAARAANDKGELAAVDSILDHPWRARSILRQRLEACGWLVFLLVDDPNATDELEKTLAELRAIDVEDGDRACISTAFVHLCRGQRDAGVEEIRSGWRALAARTGERAVAAQERFVQGLATVERTLQFLGHSAEAETVRAERAVIEKDSGFGASQGRR